MGKILLGTSGWSYEDWVGPFYKSPEESKLSRYSRVFKTVEIDSTFYAYPSRGLVWGWLRFTEPDFFFTAKIPRLITHEKRLEVKKGVEQDLQLFCDLMKPLLNGGKLGCLLIQLPPKFKADLKGTLENFFTVLPKDFRFAVELRHLSWMKTETWKLLENYNIAYTIVDEPLLPPEAHVTADFAYMRWHGKGKRPWYNYRYKPIELEPWVPKVREISGSTEKLYGYFNNHFHGYAVENCLQILEMVSGLSYEQAEAKKGVEDYLKHRVTEAEPTSVALASGKLSDEMSLEQLLQSFMDAGRLKRARGINESEVRIQELTDNRIQASVKWYHVLIDRESRTILHDCADWNRSLYTKKFCKHLGKIFLILPQIKALEILRQIYGALDEWEFKPYIAE